MRFPAVFVALLAALWAFPAIAQDIEIGDIYDTQVGSVFRGWTLTQEGLGINREPYAVFERGTRISIVRTEPISRNERGGIIISRIVEMIRVYPENGEEKLLGFDCNFLGLFPAVAFFNEHTRIARGFFVTNNGIFVRRWLVDEPELCQYSGD